MFYRLLTSVVIFCFAETAFAGTFAVANQAEADYGKVVHAFFAKDYKEALTFFDRVEKAKSNDPRPYYYAGLIYKRLKQAETSEKYYKKAAGLEFGEGVRREYDVASALVRVQGRERLTIEKFREEARTKWQAEERKRNEIKYNEQKAKDAQTVESFVQPNPAQDEKIVQALTKPADFGAKAIEPTNPSAISKVLQRTEPRQEIAGTQEETESVAAVKPETADDTEETVEDDGKDEDDDENPFDEALKRKEEAKAAAKKKQTADDEDEEESADDGKESEDTTDDSEEETVEDEKKAAEEEDDAEEEEDEGEEDPSDEKADAKDGGDSADEKEEK